MSFVEFSFVCYFLPIALILYYLLKRININISYLVMIILNFAFYAWGAKQYLILAVILSAITVVFGIFIKKLSGTASKVLLIISIICILGILAGFKICGRFVDSSIVFPLGLSFYSFRAASYLIDIYNNKIKKVKIISSLYYLTFFAQITSGPIETYEDFFKKTDGKFDQELFIDGVWRFVMGFCKKLLISNSLSNMLGSLNMISITKAPSSYLWIMSIIYSLQLYFDFSSYSDMAIGIGNMFSIKCNDNFDYPYMTKTISEFWRRWHISLGMWFRNYVYIPLGGSKCDKKKAVINLFVVWLLTGLWHGISINFIIWGLSYFILIALEKYVFKINEKKNKVVLLAYRFVTLFFVNLLWIVFRYSDINYLGQYLSRMFGISRAEAFDIDILPLINDYKVFIIAALILVFPIYPKIRKYIESKNKKIQLVFNFCLSIALMLAFIIAFSFMISGNNNPFVYANF